MLSGSFTVFGRGYTLAEILGGRYGPSGQIEWQSLRGAPNEVARMERDKLGDGFVLQVQMELDGSHWKYLIEVARGAEDAGGWRVVRESLSAGGWEPVYTSHPGDGSPLPTSDEADLHLRVEKTGAAAQAGVFDHGAVGPARSNAGSGSLCG